MKLSGRSLFLLAFVLLLLTGLTAHFVYTYWPRLIEPGVHANLPVAEIAPTGVTVRVPGGKLVGQLGVFSDEFFAYLMFDYLRFHPALQEAGVLISYSRREDQIVYPILLPLSDNLIAGLPRLYELAEQFPFMKPEWQSVDERVLNNMRSRTATFIAAYNFPAYQPLERLSRKDVVSYARRFIRFKSVTDPRVLRKIEPPPPVLSREEAEQLAEDIVTVAEFFSLPLDFFLGIGAMENNYMNVKGDIGHAVWKRRAEKGDIVLRRRGRRVLVLNESSGVWQITRETLRYAHRLYLKDSRDYSQLPERLRPPKELNFDELAPEVLTTYAAILLRQLLDRFQGDVSLAVGAYNGGPGNPNTKYEEGVSAAAAHARRMMEQAAALRGQSVADIRFLTSGSPPQ